MVRHQNSAARFLIWGQRIALLALLGTSFQTAISHAQALFQLNTVAPMSLRSVPLPACERGLKDPKFVEALDDHFNAVFAGRSLEERISGSSSSKPLPLQEKLQAVFSEVYSSDIRMKTNSLVKKFGKKGESDPSYAMPFHCLTPYASGKGFTFELSSIPCSDPENSLSAIEDVNSQQAQKTLRDLLKSGGTSGGTSLLQSCSLKFDWDKARKRYFAKKSFVKEISQTMESDRSGVTAGVKFQVQSRAFQLGKMDCPLATELVLGCNVRLHPRSEKHLFRLTQSDWMPAREAIVCKMTKDPATAFDLELETTKRMIRENPELRDIGTGSGGSEKQTQSEEQTLIRLMQTRIQISRGETLAELKKAAVDFYTPRPCNHLKEGATCNVVILSKKHRYMGNIWDTFDYGLMPQDQQTVRGFNENFSMGPFTENRSYHDLPGMVGRAFSFGDTHEIYKIGGNPSRRQVEMFCSEYK
ncbi:MAG: hypothetical protein K2X47_05600 [Bdellovibrionales bacterium]|nr:hypothetical protein [Bdellovibrionales bacterium]